MFRTEQKDTGRRLSGSRAPYLKLSAEKDGEDLPFEFEGSVGDAESVLNEAERELEELQIRTMQTMVERVNIEFEGQDFPKVGPSLS